MIQATSRRSNRLAALLATAVAAVLVVPPGRAEGAGKKVALLVGVDRYGRGTLLPGLGIFPRNDVEGMAEVLVGMGYARDDVVVMTLKAGAEAPDLLPNAEPIRNQLALTLQPLAKGDSVIVMLVGHGVMIDGKSYFCPMDANLARRGDLSKFVPLDEVFDALKACDATTKLLLVDACRNELKAAPPEARAPGIEMPAPPEPPASVAALFSCSEKEVSWQDSSLGGGHGVFSHFVIEGLKGAADSEHGDRDGSVTLDELTGYVRQKVFGFVRSKHNTSQMPRLRGDLGLVVLRNRPAAIPTPVHSDAEFAKAADLFKKGQYPEARDAFAKLQTSASGDARVFYYAAMLNGITTREWTGETERLVNRGIELEKAGTPEAAKINAAFADLPPTIKPWLDVYRARVDRDRPANASPPELITSRASGIDLKYIPAGRFWMGSAKEDNKDADDDESPRHEVRITRAFYLGMTEVTQGQYRAVTGESPSHFKGSDDLPVESVSWLDAVKYCNALSVKEGLTSYYRIDGEAVTVPDRAAEGYRLPTEAEWEYACRAGSTTRYSFGDDPATLSDHAWFGGNYGIAGNSGNTTHPVGQKRPNAFGLFDMHGNVWELCGDWYKADYYATLPTPSGGVGDPAGPFEASGAVDRVFRGGNWNYDQRFARSAGRGRIAPGDGGFNQGFRVARVRSGL